ncbi:MAG: pyridoxal phosphate-dependent aminotransferase [Chrysiogenales bacterium]|nr:MAG: pyridoxal phosphate-dependent aminotransferase [Chrysiogenales bacterium]
MKYDFDRAVERTGTGSIKWDHVDEIFGGSGLLPLWVADMDFQSPPEVTEALIERARHGVFGYTSADTACRNAMIGWFRDHHGWSIDPSWLHYAPGVVPAINLLIRTFTEPGDRVIIQKPVYHPFITAVRNNGREIANNPLILDDGIYRIDFDDLERITTGNGARLLILCNPHNPVGRAWRREELARLGRICAERGILVISAEIHCDLVHPGFRHVPFATAGEPCLMNSITCLSPGKTFNLAGLQTADLVIPREEHRRAYQRALEGMGIQGPNIFAIEAARAAYAHGWPWLDEVMKYIGDNLAYLKGFIMSEMAGVRVIKPEATYLVWLDFRGLGLDEKGLKRLLRERARVALVEGRVFGSPEGDGFARINIACPRPILAEALARIQNALDSL